VLAGIALQFDIVVRRSEKVSNGIIRNNMPLFLHVSLSRVSLSNWFSDFLQAEYRDSIKYDEVGYKFCWSDTFF
jgi:hypothetical protein